MTPEQQIKDLNKRRSELTMPYDCGEAANIDSQLKAVSAEYIKDLEATLSEANAKIEKYEQALRNIIQYLHDNDELGEEYLTPLAKKHYMQAQEVLAATKASEKNEN